MMVLVFLLGIFAGILIDEWITRYLFVKYNLYSKYITLVDEMHERSENENRSSKS